MVTRSQNLFQMNLFLVFVVLVSHVACGNLIFRESVHYGGRDFGFSRKRSAPFFSHSVTFAVKLKNLDQLEATLYNVSNPDSSNYGKHWSREEIGNLVKNVEGSRKLRDYLRKQGVKITKSTPYDELITADAPISTWEKLFQAEFHEFVHQDWEGQVIHRALEYSLSEEINEHIETVFEVVDLPVTPFRHSLAPNPLSLPPGFDMSSYANPSKIISHYNIDPSLGNSHTSQAIFECLDVSLSPKDLTSFQTYFSLPVQSLTSSVGGHVSNSACSTSIENCAEPNSDTQYLMGIGQLVPTSSYYLETCNWLTLVTNLLSMTNPPKVMSISYSSYESELTQGLVSSFNVVAMQLGVMGVTLLAASGNDGVAGWKARTNTANCGYQPQFPASSAFVTAVGATQVSFIYYCFTGFHSFLIISFLFSHNKKGSGSEFPGNRLFRQYQRRRHYWRWIFHFLGSAYLAVESGLFLCVECHSVDHSSEKWLFLESSWLSW
jgi:tripeptidyl-peptidase-1